MAALGEAVVTNVSSLIRWFLKAFLYIRRAFFRWFLGSSVKKFYPRPMFEQVVVTWCLVFEKYVLNGPLFLKALGLSKGPHSIARSHTHAKIFAWITCLSFSVESGCGPLKVI